VARRLAAHLVPSGRVVCGFGLDAAHLPGGCPPTALTEFEDAMVDAGLRLEARYSAWDGAAYSPEVGYVVAVHALEAAR
jgi:hypothetical protein